MELALTIVLLVVAAFLTFIVTIQTNRGEGMSSAVTGQASAFAGKNKKMGRDELLKKITIVTSIVFAVVIFAVNMIGYFGN